MERGIINKILTWIKPNANNEITAPQMQEILIDIVNSIPSENGIMGPNYILVFAIGSPVENAAELLHAYQWAKMMSPNFSNRIKILVAPGKFDFGASTFIIDTQYIDIVSLSADSDVQIISTASAAVNVTVNNVFIKGLDTGNRTFQIGNNLNMLVCQNCIGGWGSFGGEGITASGTFVNCTGGSRSFGGRGIASGTFSHCKGGNESFGGRSSHVVGGGSNTASGIFNYCIGGAASFGTYGTASGTFNHCEGGWAAFGGGWYAIVSGTFNYCKGTDEAFGGGGSITENAKLSNCLAGDSSFGSTGLFSGKLYYCRKTSGQFHAVTGTGRTYYCVDGFGNPNNQ